MENVIEILDEIQSCPPLWDDSCLDPMHEDSREVCWYHVSQYAMDKFSRMQGPYRTNYVLGLKSVWHEVRKQVETQYERGKPLVGTLQKYAYLIPHLKKFKSPHVSAVYDKSKNPPDCFDMDIEFIRTFAKQFQNIPVERRAMAYDEVCKLIQKCTKAKTGESMINYQHNRVVIPLAPDNPNVATLTSSLLEQYPETVTGSVENQEANSEDMLIQLPRPGKVLIQDFKPKQISLSNIINPKQFSKNIMIQLPYSENVIFQQRSPGNFRIPKPKYIPTPNPENKAFYPEYLLSHFKNDGSETYPDNMAKIYLENMAAENLPATNPENILETYSENLLATYSNNISASKPEDMQTFYPENMPNNYSENILTQPFGQISYESSSENLTTNERFLKNYYENNMCQNQQKMPMFQYYMEGNDKPVDLSINKYEQQPQDDEHNDAENDDFVDGFY